MVAIISKNRPVSVLYEWEGKGSTVPLLREYEKRHSIFGAAFF